MLYANCDIILNLDRAAAFNLDIFIALLCCTQGDKESETNHGSSSITRDKIIASLIFKSFYYLNCGC